MSKPPAPMMTYDHYTADDEWATINGDEVEDETESAIVRDWLLDVFQWNASCPFCNVTLTTAELEKKGAGRRSEPSQFDVQVACCVNCAYWQIFANAFSGGGPAFIEWHAYVANARTFEAALPQGFEVELAQSLRRDAKRWHKLTPKRLEQLVADIFTASHAPSKAFHVGRPGDEGVDVVLVESDGVERLIQVKRRQSSSATEGVSALRSLLGTMVDRGVPKGVVVSTADHFSAQALRFAERNTKKGYEINVVDRHVLDRMLSSLLPHEPWSKPLGELLEPSMFRSLRAKLSENVLHTSRARLTSR